MSKLHEITPSPESAIVPRILVGVHRALDEHLPHTGDSSRQFARTLATGPSEDTAIGAVPEGALAPASSSGPPSSTMEGLPGAATNTPLPAVAKGPEQARPAFSSEPTAPLSQELPLDFASPRDRVSWLSLVAAVVLLGGLAAVIYVFFWMP